MSDHRETHGEYTSGLCPHGGGLTTKTMRAEHGCDCDTCMEEARERTATFHRRNRERSDDEVAQAQRGAPPRRICKRCKTEKAKRDFAMQRDRADGLAVICRSCNAAYLRRYRRERNRKS